MKFLLDQGLPRSAVLHLHNAGIEAAHVGDRGLATASDAKILDFGRQEGRVVVTLDADFHALLALSGVGRCGKKFRRPPSCCDNSPWSCRRAAKACQNIGGRKAPLG